MQLQHPTRGKISVWHSIESGEICSCEGVGLRLLSRTHDSAEIEVYDAGGIFDPLDGRVQGEHYSATHFALLSAILFSETAEQKYLIAAKNAIAFHLRTAPREYAPIASWMYHWDFQNYAFILTYRFLKNELTPDERAQWENGIRSWRTNHKNKLTNWAAMRAWAFAERAHLFHNKFDALKTRWNLRCVKKARHSDGCFDDDLNRSRPLQYHIFTVAVLHRLWQVRQDQTIQRWIEEGVDYFIPLIDDDGEFNYLGRGQQQIFGSAAAIYALEAAYQFQRDPELLRRADLIFKHLLRFQRGKYFPLVLNDQPDEARHGWYDYHHLTVYNAFLGAWLGLTHLLKNPAAPASGQTQRRSFVKFSLPTHVAAVAKENYFAAFFGGLPEYLTEAGVTPYHLWWRDFGVIFSCPGAPSPARFSKFSPQGGEQNFLAPIAINGAGWMMPAAKTSEKFIASDNYINIEHDYGPFVVHRRVELAPEALRFEDSVRFKDDRQFDEFRFFNFPIQCNEMQIEIIDDARVRLRKNDRLLLLEVEGGGKFELLQSISGARGALRPLVKRELNFAVTKNQRGVVRFSFRAL